MLFKYNLKTGILAVGLLSLGWALACHADTVFLKNGTEVEGTVVEENNNTVVVKLRHGANRSFRRVDVETIVYENKPLTPKVAAPVEKPEVKVEPVKPADKAAADAKKEEKKDDKAKADDPNAKKDDKAKADDPKAKKEEDDWSPPPGLAGFPEKAKRMDKAKEETFINALEKLGADDETARTAAQGDIAALGPDALPYVVAGINHTSVFARSACMTLVAQFNGRAAVKQVIEVFFAAMPESDAAATWQVPFIRAIKATLPAISGQSFITGEADKLSVQDGLKKYIDWYQANYDRLPPQLGEQKLDATDPEYDKKLKEARALKLAKRSWPRPPMPSDLAVGPNKQNVRPAQPEGSGERPADKAYGETVQKVKSADALKRDIDKK